MEWGSNSSRIIMVQTIDVGRQENFDTRVHYIYRCVYCSCSGKIGPCLFPQPMTFVFFVPVEHLFLGRHLCRNWDDRDLNVERFELWTASLHYLLSVIEMGGSNHWEFEAWNWLLHLCLQWSWESTCFNLMVWNESRAKFMWTRLGRIEIRWMSMIWIPQVLFKLQLRFHKY